jgi:hypothetical protein
VIIFACLVALRTDYSIIGQVTAAGTGPGRAARRNITLKAATR